MKKILASVTFMLLAASAHSQSFLKGQTEINASVGFATRSVSGRVTRKTLMPPLWLTAERGLNNHFGLGVYTHASSGLSIIKPISGIGKSDSVHYTSLGAGILCQYHFRIFSRVDLYTTGILGVDLNHTTIFEIGAFVGAKYRLDDNFGIFMNAGLLSLGPVQAGLSYRFVGKNGNN